LDSIKLSVHDPLPKWTCLARHLLERGMKAIEIVICPASQPGRSLHPFNWEEPTLHWAYPRIGKRFYGRESEGWKAIEKARIVHT